MKSAIIQFLKFFPEILLVMALFFPFLLQADSDRAWPIITFTCDKAKNEVKLKNEVKWGEAGKNFQFSAEQGTYNPWSLVSLEDRGERTLISEKTQLDLKCSLSGAEYKFVIKPKIFNTNFNAKCGDRLSVKVSVYKGSSILIQDKSMETFCHGNAPVLRGIKVKGGNNKVKFYEVARSRFY
ncbi:MAG: hypothetical protein DIZ80_10945 [endosymbiont of Galathealinum brachiosum]|uniref:Uncharacterized protein n=1 Tax=endosymbiont of Galathealinum brachiosum TaxID=2200906 RepID=A0A370DD17_9GAMM|nr:MAG: hypothetical protein DIZ80_10945 [endosymbiont of Galathealinum brachiosum]